MGGFLSKSHDTQFPLTHAFDGLDLHPRPNGLPSPTAQSKAKLHQLLRANHLFNATLFNQRRFHNHTVHILASAYFLGATAETLYEIYESQNNSVAKWKEDSPAEVTDEDWYELMGNKAYERGFFDYFQEKISDTKAFDWRDVVESFLVCKDAPKGLMTTAMVSGLLHPIIHLGYAVELDDWEVASEALTLATSTYKSNNIEMLSLRKFGEPVPDNQDFSPALSILESIRTNNAFDAVTKDASIENIIGTYPELISDFVNELPLHQPTETTIRELFTASAYILTSTPTYNFFLLHLFTASHEVYEILLNPSTASMFSPENQYILLQTLWLTFIVIYINYGRPRIDPSRIKDLPVGVTEPWLDIYNVLFRDNNGEYDAHVIKAVRGLAVAENLKLEDKEEGYWTKAAYQMAFEMKGKNLDR